VEDFLSSQAIKYGPDLRNPRSTGMRVMIHAPGTIPDMKLGISVSPGIRTTIAIDQTIRTQQPAPYSNCTTTATYGSVNTTLHPRVLYRGLSSSTVPETVQLSC